MTAQHQTPLRFITAGSVDDGKSTLIGRLLYDSKALLSDQIKTLESGKSNGLKETIDFSILTDGLEAEREQGNYDRCGIPLFFHGETEIHHRRHAGARTIHAQYGYGRKHRFGGSRTG